MKSTVSSFSSLSRFCLVGIACGVMVGPAAAVNVLLNADFEDPVLAGGDTFGSPGWAAFGPGTYTAHSSILPGVGAQSGANVFKMFGTSGIFQQFSTAAGQVWNGGAWILNFSGDQMGGGQVAAVNIEWIQADGSSQSAITPFISNGTFTAASGVDRWTLQTITGTAPADAAFVRFVLITGDFLPGGPGGAPFYDNAFLEAVPEPSSSALLGLGGLMLVGIRRRK